MAQDNLTQGLKNFQRQFPQEAQKAKMEIKRVIDEGGAPSPEEMQEIVKIIGELQKNPAAWARLRPELESAGMPQEMLPPPNATKEQLTKIIGVLIITVYLIGQGPEENEGSGVVQQGPTGSMMAQRPQGLINARGM
jgi:hypothetical protein